MPANGLPRRRHHRDRRRLAVRRQAASASGQRQPRRQRHARDHAVRRLDLSVPGGRVGAAGLDRRCRGALEGDDESERARRPEAVLARGAVRRDRRARGVARRRAARRRAGRRRAHRQRRRRHRRRREAVRGLLHRGGRHVTPYAIAVGICGMVSSEISISLGLRGISHVLSCGCTSSTDAHRLRRGAHSRRRVRRAAVGRHRRLRAAGHDLRLLAHARGVDALQRPARRRRRGRSTAAATASSSAKARGCSCSSARIARWRAAPPVRARRGLRLDLRRLSPRADGSRRRRDRALHRDGARAGRTGGPRRSATSTTTARRRS